MPPIIQKRSRRGPRRQVVSARTDFYPGEVVRILKLREIDYRQLRELWSLITQTRGKRKWGRYTFRDLIALRNAIELAGGDEALKLGRRLRIKHLARVLEVLRAQFGLNDPLMDMRLERVGSSILAHVSGAKFDPMESQFVLAEIMAGVRGYLKRLPDRGTPKNLKEIELQKSQLTPRQASAKHSITLPFQMGTEMADSVRFTRTKHFSR